MSKHTPGPWHIVTDEHGNTEIITDGRPYICTVAPGKCEDVTAANARLIAAAPEMLEALEKIISSWERERLHSNQGNNHAQDEAELEKNYQIALAKLMIYEKIKAAK